MSDRDRSAPAKDAPRKNKIGARKHGSFMAISTAPSINYTPIGPAMVPIPYPTVQDLTNSVGTASSVKLNGCPAYVLDSSKQLGCKGDQPGTGGGVKSGTVSGEVKPVVGSHTVRIEGKSVVRCGDACTMNGGNNPGIFVSAQASPLGPTVGTTIPPTLTKTVSTENWLNQKFDEVRKAICSPAEGGKGAIKGTINAIPQTVEALIYGAAIQQALHTEEAANVQMLFRRTKLAEKLRQISAATRASAEEVKLPKLEMSNAAQSGGELLAVILQILSGTGGIARFSLKKLTPKVSLKTKSTATNEIKPSNSNNDGVKIIGAKSAPAAKNMTANDLADWFKHNHGISDPDKLKDMMNSFNLQKPVELVELPPGLEVVQYVREGGSVGTFFAYPGTSPGALAISSDGRILTRFVVNEPISVLKGTAAPFPTGKYPGVGGPGGGVQLIFPRGSKNFSIISE